MVKILFLIPFILFSLFSLPSLSETFDDLVIRDGLYYKKFSQVPFTGKLTGQFQGSFKNGKPKDYCQQEWDDLIACHDHGQLIAKSDFKNGKMEVTWVSYSDNGQLWQKDDYKNYKKEASWVEYWDNGQLFSKGNFKNGKEEGYHFMFFPDGRLAERSLYKNGVKISD